MKQRYFYVTLTLLLCSLVGILPAQINQLEFIRSQHFRPTFHIKSWTFDDTEALDRFTEFTIPVSYSLPLGTRLGLDVATAPFIGIKELPNGKTDEFHNVTDTFVRASFIVGDNLALLTFGVGIPSGETELTADEMTIAGLASNRPLNNPVTNFGTGFSYHFGLALAQELGTWVLGAGVGFSLRQKYDANLSGQDFEIAPGNEFNLTVGVEREFEMAGGRAKVLADFIYTNYGEDEINDAPFFEAGDKFLLRGQLLAPLGFLNPVILSAIYRWRSDNRIDETTMDASLISNGSEVELRAAFIQPLGGSFSLKYVAQAQLYGDNDLGFEGATIYGFGGGFVLNFSNRVSFDPTFIYSKGSIDVNPQTEVDVTGLELRGGLAFRF